jgi:hypothetical protein
MTDGNLSYWADWLPKHGNLAAARRVDADLDNYLFNGLSQTARNRVRFAWRNGFESRIFTVEEYNERLDEIYAIRSSTPVRQGNPMRESYLRRPIALEYRDYNTLYGCFNPDGVLVAYIIGQYTRWLAAASTIIGHADYIGNTGAMYQVWFEFIKDVIGRGDLRYIVYSKWTDGKDGLREWKHSVGLSCMDISNEIL